MKKIFFILVAFATIAACSKSEVTYTENDSISFSPVAYNQTKAAIAAGSSPTCPLIVSAFAGTTADQTTYSEPYFKNVEFTDANLDGIFEASGYFWPNVKKLTFAGITKSAGFTESSSVSIYDASNTITDDRDKFIIYNYAQPNVDVDHNDLMWFDRTTPAGKTNNAIDVTMKHACTWIVLNFIGDPTSGNAKRPWKITNVTINGLSQKENVTLSTGTAVWTSTGAKTNNLVVYNNGSMTSGGTALSNGGKFTPSTDGIIVIPQKPTTLSITYNYVTQFGADDTVETDDIVIEETATVELNFDGTADTPDSWSNWSPGTKYTYDVTIGAAAIKIAPKAAEWTIYDADGDSGNKDNIEIPR